MEEKIDMAVGVWSVFLPGAVGLVVLSWLALPYRWSVVRRSSFEVVKSITDYAIRLVAGVDVCQTQVRDNAMLKRIVYCSCRTQGNKGNNGS